MTLNFEFYDVMTRQDCFYYAEFDDFNIFMIENFEFMSDFAFI